MTGRDSPLHNTEMKVRTVCDILVHKRHGLFRAHLVVAEDL